jgi:hypothetical protein
MLELHDPMFAASPERLNWLPFTGTCLFADQPSDGIPSGGVDKPVRFPSAELDKALDSMVDMGVDCEWPDEDGSDDHDEFGRKTSCGPEEAFSGHDDRFKIGVVKTSVLKDNEMVISGGLWSNDFSDICDMYRNAKASLGFSVEVYFNLVDQGEYYDAVDIEFTGVAILFSDLAAFKDTYIAAKRGGDKKMTKEEMKELLDANFKAQQEAIEGLTKQLENVALGFAEDRAARKEAEEKAQAELAAAAEAAKLEEQKKADEAAKAAAELAAKQQETEAQRKSLEAGAFASRFKADEADAIVNNTNLTPSQKFQALIKDKI